MSVNEDIIIHWEGAWRIGEEFRLPRDSRLQSTMGVYYINTKGSDGEILYIGHTYKQTFSQRVPQHRNDGLAEWLDKYYADVDVFLRIGHLELNAYGRISPSIVGDVESLLIGALKPPGNVSKMKTYAGREMTIRNAGARWHLPKFFGAIPRGFKWLLKCDDDPNWLSKRKEGRNQ